MTRARPPRRDLTPLARRTLLLAVLTLPAAAQAPAVRPSGIGTPVGRIDQQVTEARINAYLNDLADFANFYDLAPWGEPSNLVVDGRPVLLVWFTRADGLTVLVTDATQAERMQAYFYAGPGGFPRNDMGSVMKGFMAKMSGYPTHTGSEPGAAR